MLIGRSFGLVAALLLIAGGAQCSSLIPDPRFVSSGAVTQVTALPGWNGTLPLTLYSGFVDIASVPPPNAKMLMHYLFYEQEQSPASTADGPILVWFSGGPGAPSSWGTFVENGPFLLNQESWLSPLYNEATGTPGLIWNDFAWTKFASVLAFDNPPPTGFSHCTPPGPKGNGSACGVWNDTRVGIMNAEAIDTVLRQHFPQSLSDPNRLIIIAGESYGGVYITSTVQEIATHTKYAEIGSRIDGIALGDACMGTAQICGYSRGPGAWLAFMYGHGQYPSDMWDDLHSKCTAGELRWGIRTPACSDAVKHIKAAVGSYYVYNLFDDCPDNIFDADPSNARRSSIHRYHFKQATIASKEGRGQGPRFGDHSSAQFNGYWCPGNVFHRYMNLSTVRQALNVPLDANFFIEDDAVGMPYNLTLTDGFALWAPLLRNTTSIGAPSTLTRPFRLMSYNGDADAAVVQQETEPTWYAFARNNSFPRSAEWRSWVSQTPDVVGGYIVEWLGGRVSYGTVRGAGHMVPEYKARAAAVLMKHFALGEALPKS